MSRPLPSAQEAEKCILGTLLIHQGAAAEVAGFLHPDDCYVPAHQEVLRAALALHADGQPIDIVALETRLGDGLRRAGGLEGLTALAESATVPAALEHHCRLVRDRAALRKLILACSEISSRAYDEESSDALIRDTVDAARACYRSELRSATGDELVAQIAAACEHRWKHPEEAKPLGVTTGLLSIDNGLVFSGLPRGHVTIVAADTSRGKSALAQAAMRNAAKAGHYCLDVTLEDKQMARMTRHLSAESGMHNKSLQSQIVKADQWMHFTESCMHAAGWGKRMRFIDREEACSLPVDDMLSAAHRIVDKHEVGLVTFDYLQLITSGKNFKTRQEHVDYTFDAIERWAGRHSQTACVVVSQMNRRDENERPRLKNLYHSAKLEQGAHTVLLIWAPKTKGDDYNCRAVDIAKQKDGPTGLTVQGWEGKTVRWFNPDPIEAAKYLHAIGGER